MKRLLSIGLLLSLLAACTPKGDDGLLETLQGTSLPATASPELAAVDSLLWQQPDSALACLVPWFDTLLGDVSGIVSTAYDRHYAQLLLAELLYKNDYAQTNRAELLQTVGYFDSLTVLADTRGVSLRSRPRRDARRASAQNIAFLDARAHYINGVGYYEHDSVVDACKEYMKALEVMEEHFKEEDLTGHEAQFMALNYTRLTALFSDLYLHEQAIYFGKESLHYYRKYEASPMHVAWVLDEIGLHFDILHNYDSADYYYKEGVKVLSDTNNLSFRDLATHLAFISYNNGGIKPSLNQLYSILSQSESKQEYASRCLTIGEIYYHEKEFDSAWLYLNNVFNLSQIIGAKKQAAEWLVEICKAQDKMWDMHKYAEFLVPFANQEENNSGLKSQLTELYNKHTQKVLEQRQLLEKMKHATQALLAIVGLLIIMVIVVFLYRKNKRSRQKLEVQIEVERHAHKMQQAALAGRLKRSNAALREQNKKETRDFKMSSVEGQIPIENYADEPICQQILAACNNKNKPIKSSVPVSAYKDIALSNAQKAQLKEAAIRHYNALFNKLKQLYPELKEKDLFYCYLCLLGLDNAQIAVMTQLSYRTIWEREKRLQQLFNNEDKIAIILNEILID